MARVIRLNSKRLLDRMTNRLHHRIKNSGWTLKNMLLAASILRHRSMKMKNGFRSKMKVENKI